MITRTLPFSSLVVLSVLLGCSSTAGLSNADGGAPTSANGGTTAHGGSSAGATTANNGGASAAGASNGGSSAGAGLGGALVTAGGSSGGSSGASTAGGTGTTGGAGTAGGAANGGTSSGAAGQASGGAATSGGNTGAGGNAGSGGGGTGAPGLRIVGRTAAGTNGAVRFSWPGVTVNARFTGTQVSMSLNDANNKNRFTVVIDGGTPKVVTSTSGQASLPLATGLSNGTHDLVFWRNTEASIGVTQLTGLTGFSSGGALQPPAAAPARRIEVIGDSLSVGAGVEGTSTTCTPGIDAFTNNYLAYGSVAARSVQADVVTIAWSGIGVYVSYGGTAPTMPQRYDYAIPNDNTAWDFTKYQPQVVVINLGTNDFASGNPGQPYVDAYVAFVKHVRTKYASASFILIDMYGGDRLTAINNVVTALKNGGESQVQTLSFSSVPNNNTACNQHPNVTAQAAMGALLAARLKSSMGW
jgi:Carbohydrate esterase 2 N-terminal/GDSL-like Lipase/Acylhydrolase family